MPFTIIFLALIVTEVTIILCYIYGAMYLVKHGLSDAVILCTDAIYLCTIIYILRVQRWSTVLEQGTNQTHTFKFFFEHFLKCIR